MRFLILVPNELFIFRARSTHKNPIQVRDAATGQGAKVRVSLDADRSDNPMQSESACHVGANGNHNCRKCDSGGTTTEKESDAGYHQLFSVCSPSLNATINHLVLTTAIGWKSSVLDQNPSGFARTSLPCLPRCACTN